MSGLTLGLMSLSIVDLEVLAKSGTPNDRKHAVTAWVAILISVTLILLVGEIIPQSICSRYGLAIGSSLAPFVRVLVWVCYPIAYPISKLLDYLLGNGHVALFRRAELKTLVDLHGNAAGKGGELTHDETTIIAGALELTQKTAKDAMQPISDTFTIDINAKLDRDLMKQILEKGHSRVPVYYEQHTNIIGLILVKNLLTIHPADEVPIKNVTIRHIPWVPETMPLYDILNQFQKGNSHMAAVIRSQDEPAEMAETKSPAEGKSYLVEVRVDTEGERHPKEVRKTKRRLQQWKSFPSSDADVLRTRSKKWDKDILSIDECPLAKLAKEAIGIITMEDVIEELLQEEIFDETDHHYENSSHQLS
ncbi:hypothetical protein IFM89_020268 [Coptis chinensis]|uniref:CNNM transmembrane domain-containing protein n=1 Tax=Coptis chinensis TaxID=261450 RepID=A0A835HKV8_9MAGN|nr:hypothetical protein IFM89_020268 [Coptis chinensis]